MNLSLMDKLKKYDAIGFDMDNTIAKYKMESMLTTVWSVQVDFLVNHRGYHPSLRDVVFNPDSDHWYTACKGIVYDVDQGTLILLNEDGSVDKALRAHQELTADEIDLLYPNDRKPHFLKDLIQTYSHSSTHIVFESSFDIVCTVLINELMSRSQAGPPHPNKSPREIWQDIDDSLNHIYSDSNLEERPDGFKHKVIKNPHMYLEKVSHSLKQFLRELREQNKFLFFMTASGPDYTSHVMDYVWGEDWMTCFDMVIMSSRKPHFFTQTVPFLTVEGESVVENLKIGEAYLNGNYEDLQRFIMNESQSSEPLVVYFGDSCRSDIIPVATVTKWDVWSIVEELEEEAEQKIEQSVVEETASHPVFKISNDDDDEDDEEKEEEGGGGKDTVDTVMKTGGSDCCQSGDHHLLSPTSVWTLHSHPLSMPNFQKHLLSDIKCSSSKDIHKDSVDMGRVSKSWGCGFHCSDGKSTLWYSLIKRNSSAVLQRLNDIVQDSSSCSSKNK